jgi:MarR family transcriptional regulator, organic hydroperoxide resistance regulator
LPLSESESKVLLALLKESQAPIMSIPELAGLGGNAVYNSVRWLSEKGLTTDIREKEPPRRRMIGLTDKGRKVASLLEQVERQL